jgi:hypothetical protein
MSDKKLYLVETVSMFRMRYVVEVTDEQQALDEVTFHASCGEQLKEFSQKHIDEVIVSSRKLSNKSYLKLFDKDNDYLKDWNEEQKFQYVNKIDYEK